MILDVPFFKNDGDGLQCAQAAMRSVINYFLNRDLTLAELDGLTNRKAGFNTWLPQIVTVLYDLGLDLEYSAGYDILALESGEPAIRDLYKDQADLILSNTDLSAVIPSIKLLKKYNLFQLKHRSIEELKANLKDNHLVIIWVDHPKLNGFNDKPLVGHFVVLTGFDDSGFYYHENGPASAMPNKKASFETLKLAADLGGNDEDVIIIKGLR